MCHEITGRVANSVKARLAATALSSESILFAVEQGWEGVLYQHTVIRIRMVQS